MDRKKNKMEKQNKDEGRPRPGYKVRDLLWEEGYQEFRQGNFYRAKRYLSRLRNASNNHVTGSFFANSPSVDQDNLEEMLYAWVEPIGYCCKKLGDYEGAKESGIRNAKLLTSGIEKNYQSAGDIYRNLGDYEKAREMYQMKIDDPQIHSTKKIWARERMAEIENIASEEMKGERVK
jgi:tetratricopeptide (TPR) repeat protein